jgi:hypothetical protein
VAYYTRSEDRITVIRDEQGRADTAGHVATFAHELVHAMQEEEGTCARLARLAGRHLDGSAVFRAIKEGEAVLYEQLAQGHGPGSSEFRGATQRKQYRALQRAGNAEAPLTLAFAHLPYAMGANRLAELWKQGGAARVASMLDDPPSTSVALLGAEAPEHVQPVRCPALQAPREYERVAGDDRLGPLALFALRSKWGSWWSAWQHIGVWRGDRLRTWSYGESHAAAWQIRLKDAHAADALSEQLTSSAANVRVNVSGATVTLIAPADAAAELQPCR